MTKISILKVVESTTVDGPGLRTSIYCAGCVNGCVGCHNPQSWDIKAGVPTDIDDLMKKIVDEDFCNVTFTGGDPMYQAKEFAQLARRIKSETDKNIWCYTGYTYEHIKNNAEMMELFENLDVLVDGPFVSSLKDENLIFKGSSNQRLIDVKKTLESGNVVEVDLNAQLGLQL